MNSLPLPKVVRCFFDKRFQPHLPAMELEWDPEAHAVADRTWYLPSGVLIHGPAPTRFGVVLERTDKDGYSVRLLWNDVCMTWSNLRKVHILTSGVSLILRALDTDLWYILDQPIDHQEKSVARVA